MNLPAWTPEPADFIRSLQVRDAPVAQGKQVRRRGSRAPASSSLTTTSTPGRAGPRVPARTTGTAAAAVSIPADSVVVPAETIHYGASLTPGTVAEPV
ncbi:hypothetical protein AB4Y67_00690 [Arthrobacter sp. YAF17]|uniref:hypothetical protein n=1 Tax=Arthrobacter sp. YAF17 TaxID=3233077 RepID=UPI003F8FF928